MSREDLFLILIVIIVLIVPAIPVWLLWQFLQPIGFWQNLVSLVFCIGLYIFILSILAAFIAGLD